MTLEPVKWSFPDDSSNPNVKYEIIPYEEKPINKKSPLVWKFPSIPKKDDYINLVTHREPVVTYCITPNNAPEEMLQGFNDRFGNIGMGNKRPRQYKNEIKVQNYCSQRYMVYFKDFTCPTVYASIKMG